MSEFFNAKPERGVRERAPHVPKHIREANAAVFAEAPVSHSTYIEDAIWAYHNLHNDGATLQDAPSPGAWGLLLRARVDGKVLDQPLMLAAKRAQIDGEEEAIRRDCSHKAEDIRRLIRKLLEQPL